MSWRVRFCSEKNGAALVAEGVQPLGENPIQVPREILRGTFDENQTHVSIQVIKFRITDQIL
jgi:hypothetical protein